MKPGPKILAQRIREQRSADKETRIGKLPSYAGEALTAVRFLSGRTLGGDGDSFPQAVVAGWTGELPESLAEAVIADGSAVAT